ncbi:type IV pilus assembly protein PilM [Deinobacterium chartae]|uniref:Type IV pilus assembly protein PilM n=1 Tax=Deinobacterium chartae TaxID=521158 RepID=A0A841HZT1_9DEIO|nr:type IV pilus assembly protein PilM [Deinobacterium chartae]MBB6097709.1 type IV pilus assembly protein PilM [Deinobacterium chartae]
MRNIFKRLLNTRIDAIGLEIGTSAIKIVELRPGSPPVLVQAVSAPTPVGSMQDGTVVEPQAVAQAIKDLMAQHRIAGRYAVTTIANQSAITRNISVPKMDRKELDEAIKWEAERYIPYPIEDVVLDYDLLDNPADLTDEAAQMELVIAAAPHETISRQVEVIKLAGLEPLIIDVKPFAALRALRGNLLGAHLNKTTLSSNHYTEDGEVAVMLEIGASSTAIALVRGDRVLMTRNINISADDFTTALQRAFNLDFPSAEEIKLQYAAATIPTDEDENLLDFDANRERYSPMRVYEIIRPVLNDLITEIRRSLEFYRVQSGDINVDRMYLSGGGAKLRGLAGAISDALGLRVELGNPWLALQVDEGRFDKGFLQSSATEYTVPVGLALRGVTGLD